MKNALGLIPSTGEIKMYRENLGSYLTTAIFILSSVMARFCLYVSNLLLQHHICVPAGRVESARWLYQGEGYRLLRDVGICWKVTMLSSLKKQIIVAKANQRLEPTILSSLACK